MHNGNWLVKVGTYEIPLSLIRYDTYTSYPLQRQDMDSYVDADGYLHRTVMEHSRSKIEFELITLSQQDFEGFMANIVANYVNEQERRVHLTYYNDEHGNYLEGDFYMPASLEIKRLNKGLYAQTRIAFIEY